MKTTLLKNAANRDSNHNYIEFFGLSRAGKTRLLKELISKGNSGFLSEDFTKSQKLFLFLTHIIKKPIKTLSLFFELNKNKIIMKNLSYKDKLKIAKLRNSYLASVLAKSEHIKDTKSEFLIDEFTLQALFIILQNKSSEIEIRRLLNKLTPKGNILLIETPKEERYKRISQTRFPAQQINKDYAIKWMENSEHNYEIIKKSLLKEYGPVINNPKL